MEPGQRVMFRQIYSGIIGVVQDLCTKGSYQEEYLKHAACVKGVRMEYETCSKKYEVTLTSLSNYQREVYFADDQSHEAYLRTVCCSIQEYLLCSERTVQKSCGEDAAIFTSAFLRRMASNIIRTYCLEYRGQECGLVEFKGLEFGMPGASAGVYPSVFLASVATLSHYVTHFAPA